MAVESTFKNLVITLSVVCLVASAILGGVYSLTKNPIEEAQIAKINKAIGGVVPAFDNDPSAEKFNIEVNGKKSVIYPAKKEGKPVGYAVEAFTTKGFSGRIVLMVGFNPAGEIINTAVISHAETPGLGAKITDKTQKFITQFEGKNPGDTNFKFSVKKDGGDLDAITASTITSRAFVDAIENAYKAFLEINKQQGIANNNKGGANNE